MVIIVYASLAAMINLTAGLLSHEIPDSDG